MKPSEFELDRTARERWTSWLQATLDTARSSQKAVAIDLGGDDGSARRSDVSRFVTGDPGTLRSWFTRHTDRLAILGRHTGLTEDALRAKLAALQRGELESEIAWHPAFPALRLADVEIPAAFEGEHAEAVKGVIEQLVSRLGDPTGWPASAAHEKLGLIGPPGPSREIAARQIQASLQQALDLARERATSKATEDQKKPQRGPRPGPAEISTLRVEVVSAPAPAPPPQGVLYLLVMDDEQARETANIVPPSLVLRRWGAAQAVALAHRLAEHLPPAQARVLQDFAKRVQTTPAVVGEEASPDLVIRLLREVLRHGCPRTVAAARDLLASAAWEQAQLGGGAPLEPFDEALMDRLMAALAVRVRIHRDDVRAWTEAPRQVVLEALRVALREQLGPAAGRPLAALVEAAKQARGPARPTAFEALERALASEPAEPILDALVRGGVFVEEQRYAGPILRITEPPVASVWAARGLGNLPALDPDWQRLLDPHWLVLIDEFARRGAGLSTLHARFVGCPPALSLDAAAWTLRLAWSAPDPVSIEDLRPAWAAMVWAHAHGMYSSMNGWGEGPWGRWMSRALREVSHRYRRELPTFEHDPTEELARHVPEVARALVARWRRTPAAGEPRRESLQFWGLYSWGDLRDQTQLRRRICDLCPDQVVPTEPWAFDWWDGEDLARGLRRLVERATEGDDRAIRLLDGRAWLEEQNEAQHTEPVEDRGRRSHPLADQIWRQMPASLLVKWVSRARHSGVDAARLLHALAVRAKTEEREAMEADLLELATAADRNWVEKMCLDSLLTDPTWRPPAIYAPLVWRIAERLELRELLRELVDAPGLLLPETRLRLREGGVQIEPASEWIPPLEITSVGPDRDLGLRIHLDELIDTIEHRAHDAAMALYRLGEREPLRARWRTGPAYLTDLPLWRDGDRVEGILSIVVGGFPSPWCTVKELQALGTIQGQEWKEQTYLPVVVRSERGGQLARPWLLEALKSRADVLRPELQDIGRGVRVLLHNLPDDLPPEVERLLTRGHRRIMVGAEHHGGHLYRGWRSRAATALLDLGDDGPLRAWAYANDKQVGLEGPDRPPTDAVARWLLDDRARLDWAWSAVRDEAQAGRLEGDQLQQVEWRLLAEGSDCTRFSERSSHASGDASLPRPYVVAEAIRTSDVEVWMRLHDLNRRHPAWLQVIRAALPKAPDDRTRSALALDLSQHVQDPPELERAVRTWALTDPEPFLGGPTFDWRGGRAVGGVLPLLDALAARADTWVNDGLIRLWRLALVLPITDLHVRYETARWDEDRPAEPMVLEADVDLPTLLAELARHLEARGQVSEILDAWRSPPVDPAPQLEGDLDRPGWIRRWLRPLWLRLADAPTLLAALRQDPMWFPLDVLEELIRRRTPGLEPFSARLARETAPAVLRPILDLDPGAAAPIIAERFSEPVAPPRLELAIALADAGSRRSLHLGVLRALRDAVDALVPEQASITSAEG